MKKKESVLLASNKYYEQLESIAEKAIEKAKKKLAMEETEKKKTKE